MFKDVMLDLETLAKGARAHIIQIAAIAFDRDTGELGARFNMYVRGAQSGRTIDPDTVAWWMQQAHATTMGAELAGEEPSKTGAQWDSLWGVLCHFQEWYRAQETSAGGVGELRVWSHGAPFDIPIVDDACRERLDIDGGPWSYKSPRDTRTLFDVSGFDPKSIAADPARSHDALYDCELQIKQVCAAFAKLRQVAADTREQCAGICETMVVGGRAWNDGQRVAADALFSAAKAIRSGAVDAVADTQPGVAHPSPYPFADQESLNAYASDAYDMGRDEHGSRI